jgi:hypothetical protein
MMLTTVLDAARNVAPELWRRYLGIVIQSPPAQPTAPESLVAAPLGLNTVPLVMAAFKLPRR